MDESTKELDAGLITGDRVWNYAVLWDLTAVGVMRRSVETINAEGSIAVAAPRLHAVVTDS